MAVIINDKVYGVQNKPLSEDEKTSIEVMKHMVQELREKVEMLEQEGLSGFGDENKRLKWSSITRLKGKITKLNVKIEALEERQRKSEEVSIHMAEEDTNRKKKRGVK